MWIRVVDDPLSGSWKMPLGNRWQNASVPRGAGAGHVAGWNLYVDTPEDRQSNGALYAADVQAHRSEWSFWYATTNLTQVAWRRLWTGVVPVQNQFYHLAIVYVSQQYIKFYVDCTLVATDTTPDTIYPQFSLPFTIGRTNFIDEWPSPATTTMDWAEFNFFDTSLSQAELSNYCNQCL